MFLYFIPHTFINQKIFFFSMADYEKYIVPVLIVFTLVLSLLLVRPFIAPLLAGAIVAYLFYPLFMWLSTFIKNRTVVATLVTFIMLLLFIAPLVLVLTTFSQDAYPIYLEAKQILLQGDLLESCTAQVCATVKTFFENNHVRLVVQRVLESATTSTINYTSRLLITLPQRALELFIGLFVFFYLLKDGDKIKKKLISLLHMAKKKKEYILKRFDDMMYAIVFGSILVAFLQGFLGTIGFALFGIKSPIVWGIIMFFLALIPHTGTGLVWIPASLLMIIQGMSLGDNLLILKGIGLFGYGLIFIGAIDNILRPKIIGERSRIHPIIILIGILGGIGLMGLSGIFVGPVILAMTLTLIDLYVAPGRKSRSA